MKFTVYAARDVYCSVTVEAKSKEEAYEIASSLDEDEFDDYESEFRMLDKEYVAEV